MWKDFDGFLPGEMWLIGLGANAWWIFIHSKNGVQTIARTDIPVTEEEVAKIVKYIEVPDPLT